MMFFVFLYIIDQFFGSVVDVVVFVVLVFFEFVVFLVDYFGFVDVFVGIGFMGVVGFFICVYVLDVMVLLFVVVGVGVDFDVVVVCVVVGVVLCSFMGFDYVVFGFVDGFEFFVEVVVEGVILGGYCFDGYCIEKGKMCVIVVIFYVSLDDVVVVCVQVVGDVVVFVKDFVNVLVEWQSFVQLVQSVVDSVVDFDVMVEILDEIVFVEQGFGGIFGVGQGLDCLFCFVCFDYFFVGVIRYIVLVGKGIIFDIGGFFLKLVVLMVGMKFDMVGVVILFVVLCVIVMLGFFVYVSVWFCIIDNMFFGCVLCFGDVICIFDGMIVEVQNIDVEGWLVFVDGLVVVSCEQLDVIIDVVMFIGVIVVVFGYCYIGVFGDDDMVVEFFVVVEWVDEFVWYMLLLEYMEELLEFFIVDLQNVNMGDWMGGVLFVGFFF